MELTSITAIEVVLRALISHNHRWKRFMARTLILVLQAKCGACPKLVWADICLECEEVVQTFLGWTILSWTSALYHYEPFFFFFLKYIYALFALFTLDDHHGRVWSWCYNTTSYIYIYIYIFIYIGEHMKNDNYFGQMLFLLFLQINYF